jgi:hypothetical protein
MTNERDDLTDYPANMVVYTGGANFLRTGSLNVLVDHSLLHQPIPNETRVLLVVASHEEGYQASFLGNFEKDFGVRPLSEIFVKDRSPLPSHHLIWGDGVGRNFLMIDRSK